MDQSWSTELIAVYVADVILIVIAITLNLLGITLQLVTKTRDMSSNQSILLIHLSVTSMISIGTNASAIYHKAYRIRFPEEFIVFYFIAYMSYIINLVYLTADRFLFVFLNLKYYKYMTKRVLAFGLVMLWIVSIGYGLFIKYAKFINHTDYNKYASHVYNGTVCVFTVLAYMAILVKLKIGAIVGRSKSTAPNKVINRPPYQQSMKAYVVPLLIVLTFFLFNIVPSILTAEVKVKGRKQKQLYIIGLIGVNILNNISDPLLYIFLQPRIQKKLIKYLNFCCTGGAKNRNKQSVAFSLSDENNGGRNNNKY